MLLGRRLFAITSLIVIMEANCQLNPRKHRMEFQEEQEPGTVVANLPQMFNVRFNDLPGRYFEILGQRMKIGNKVVIPGRKWLKIDRLSGVISVNEPVDRETECGEDFELECTITVQTAMLPQNHFRLQNFELIVTDVNDHSPKFPTAPRSGIFQLNISEDTPVQSTINIDQFMATDEDMNQNAVIHYTMTRNDHFVVSEYEDDTGAQHLQLSLQSPLDYENTPQFDVDLIATDGGSPIKRSGQLSLRINVIDVNDNAPVFDESVYDLRLRENLPVGHVIATVHASDLDKGLFGEVRYFVPSTGNSISARRFVSVDRRSGEVKLRRSPDREEKKKVKIILAAEDSPGLTEKKIGRTVLMIHITDVNDNAPQIDVNVIIRGQNDAACVSENAELGTYLAHVSASDADHGQAGQVVLMIDSIRVLSSENESESSTTSKSTDRTNYFVLKDNLISTNRHLDRELENQYLIKIKACDRGVPKKCSTKLLKVLILDFNDQAPKFGSAHHFVTLAENMKVGSEIDSVHATDLDSIRAPALSLSQNGEFEESKNGEVRYSLIGGGRIFAIDSISGSIKLVGKLDWESRPTWKIVAVARDLGKPSKESNLTVTVKVTDVNDHPPTFIKPSAPNSTVYATILEDRTIIRIKTLDRDSGDNAEVWYAIAAEDGSDKSQKFLIDPVTGSIRFNASNKLTELLGDHTLLIKASDKGSPPLQSTMPINVKVVDLPLSEVIPNYHEDDEEQNTKITAIILSSLASITLILLVVLVCIVLKCRREKKEFKVYNFRTEEIGSRSGLSCASTINIRTSDKDESVNTLPTSLKRMRTDRRTDCVSLSDKASMAAQTSENELKFTTFSRQREDLNETARSKTPEIPPGDGDSGRGDSDKDTDSCIGDRDKSHISHPPTRAMQYRYPANMGERCTPACRNYGHSDECWMPAASDPGYSQDTYRNDSNSDVVNYAYANGERGLSQSYYLDSISNDPRSLETISETQPLRVMLDLANPPLHTCRNPANFSEYPSLTRKSSQPSYHGTPSHSRQGSSSDWCRPESRSNDFSSQSYFPETSRPDLYYRTDVTDSRIQSFTFRNNTEYHGRLNSTQRPQSACATPHNYQSSDVNFSSESLGRSSRAGSLGKTPSRRSSLRRHPHPEAIPEQHASRYNDIQDRITKDDEYDEKVSLTESAIQRTEQVISNFDRIMKR